MANSLYKDRLIVVFTGVDPISTFWIPMADTSVGKPMIGENRTR